MFSRPETDSLPVTLPSAPMPKPEKNREPAGILANDLRLICTPRKVPSGRLAHLLELAYRAVRATRAGIALLSPDGDLIEHLSVATSRDEGVELEGAAAFLELLQATSRQPAPTRLERGAWNGQSGATFANFGAFLGVPLNCAGRCRGVLYLVRRLDDGEFTREDEELLAPIGSWLDQANLSEEARLLNRLRVLNQVAYTAAGNLDLHSILAVSVRELDRLLPLHVNAVWLVEDANDHLALPDPDAKWEDGSLAAESHPPSLLAVTACTASPQGAAMAMTIGLRLLPDEAVFRRCLQDGCAAYTDAESLLLELSGPAAAQARVLAEGGATSCFAVPLRAGKRTLGVLQSICTRPAGFTGEQLQLLYLVADLLGPAISSCRLFRHLSAAYEELRKTQNQLIQAEKMRALGELAGGVAHEFNNALCGVLGFLELALLNTGLDPTNRGFLESARTCATDAAQTVRRVQDFARWRRNERTSQRMDLGEFVSQTVDLIRHKWEGRGAGRGGPIRLAVDTENNVFVTGNATELREVITNLAFNAVEAMPSGGTLTIRTWKTPTDAFLSIRDTGVGIASAVRHRLFEPFFTTKGEHGNGLGLSVAFGIVRRHAGEIGVESEEGRGADFTVRLPLATAPTSRERLAKTGQPTPAGRALRVLVVEDEESVRRFLDTGLTRLGHHPRLAPNVEEATRALAEDAFDVVLTDLGLPDASGEEVARRVAACSPGTPVVLLTGWADQLRAENRTIAGIARILSKPVALDTLAAALASVAG